MIKNTEKDVQNFVADFYEELRYQREYSRYYHTWWNQTMLSFISGKSLILDNGCGTGILLEMLVKDHVVVGSDISYSMLKYAQKRANVLVLGDSQSLPFQGESFDIILGRSLLHHLSNPSKGIEEMARVLTKNGEMVIVDTNHSFLSSLPRYLAKKGEHFSDEHKNMRADELIKSISKYFIVEHVFYFGYLAYPLGFPDIFDIGKFIPCPLLITKLLIAIDAMISRIPIIRKQSWGIMIKGHKK